MLEKLGHDPAYSAFADIFRCYNIWVISPFRSRVFEQFDDLDPALLDRPG